MTVDEAALVFTDPKAYADEPRFHAACALLRRESPVARVEARALYAELVPRLESIELAGEPAYMETLFIGGPKHLPIRYAMSPRRD